MKDGLQNEPSVNDAPMKPNLQSNLEEDSISDIMEQLSLSEPEAREWRAAVVRRLHGNRERIYNFVRMHNPKVAELEKSGIYAERIRTVTAQMKISEATATALVIYPEVTGGLAMKLWAKLEREGKENCTREDIQELLGVKVPIPPDVWDAFEFDHADKLKRRKPSSR